MALECREAVLRTSRRHAELILNPKPYLYKDIGLSRLLSEKYLISRFYQYGPNNYGDMEQCENIVIFYSQTMRNELNCYSIWSVYGSFDVCSTTQLKIIHNKLISTHHIFPCVFVLLKNKPQATYTKCLES